MPSLPVLPLTPPLDKTRFDNTWKTFCQQKNIKINPNLLQIDNRPIDLHALHTIVMQEGGSRKVENNDLWAVIGGRMGFVAFPGTDTEPNKSGPAAAQQLAHVYKSYLQDFDTAYLQSVYDSRRKLNGNGTAPQAVVYQIQNQVCQRVVNRLNPQQMQAVLTYT